MISLNILTAENAELTKEVIKPIFYKIIKIYLKRLLKDYN